MTNIPDLAAKTPAEKEQYFLDHFCARLPTRRVANPRNQDATAFAAMVLASGQLMPKILTFYYSEHYSLVLALLKQGAPAVIISPTGRNPELAGVAYPFPLIENGDFDIPSVYTPDMIGEKLAPRVGQTAHIQSDAERIPSTGCNVVANSDLSAL